MKNIDPPPPVAAVLTIKDDKKSAPASSTDGAKAINDLILPAASVAADRSPKPVAEVKKAPEAKPTPDPKAVEPVVKPTEVAAAQPTLEKPTPPTKPAAPTKSAEPTVAGYAPDLTKPTPTSVSTGASTFARAEDYSWVQGRLFRVHTGGGYWQIRYQSHEQSDEYGGRFLLTGPAANDLKEGDVVRIEGAVQSYDDRHRTTAYRVNALKVIHKGAALPLAN
jgi:hypothetical protein